MRPGILGKVHLVRRLAFISDPESICHNSSQLSLGLETFLCLRIQGPQNARIACQHMQACHVR